MPGHETREAIRRARAKIETTETHLPALTPHVEALRSKYLALAEELKVKYGVSA